MNVIYHSTLRALSLAIIACSVAFAQHYDYPTGEAAKADYLELRVVDRYMVPVPGVSVKATASLNSASSCLTEAPMLLRSEEPHATDDDGRVAIQAHPNEVIAAEFSKHNYAPYIAYPLFSGYQYLIVLDLGSPATIHCVDEHGVDVGGVEVRLYWNNRSRPIGVSAAQLLGGAPLCIATTDEFGRATFSELPIGMFSALCKKNGLSGVKDFEVSSAFGVENTAARLDMTVVLGPSATLSIACEGLGANAFPMYVVVDQLVPNAIRDLSYWSNEPRISTPTLPAGMLSGIRLFPQEYGTVSIQLIDYSGQVVEPPRSVNFDSVPTREVQIDVEQVRTRWPQAAVYVPALDSVQYGTRNWTALTADNESGLAHVDLRTETDVAAVVVGEGVRPSIVGYFVATEQGGSRFVPSAHLTVRYNVEGNPVGGAVVRIRPGSKLRAGYALMSPNTAVTNPAGMLDIGGLLPGDYYLELHEHYTVFKDSVVRRTLEPGEQANVECSIRRGHELSGIVLDSTSGEPIGGGTVELRCAEAKPYDRMFAVDSGGRFRVTGLCDEDSYELLYRGEQGLFSVAESGQEAESTYALRAPFPEQFVIRTRKP